MLGSAPMVQLAGMIAVGWIPVGAGAGSNDWVSAAGIVSPGSGASFSNSGTLTAGLYQIRNTPNVIVRTQTPVTSNQWDYTLTLYDTTVTAVPEPARVVSMLAGLGFIGWRLRRRAVM